MDAWAATVSLRTTGPAAQAATAPSLPEGLTLARHEPEHGRAAVQLTVHANDLPAATAAATKAVTAAVSDWPGASTIVGAEVLLADEAAHLAAHPVPLDLVDDTGAAELLSVRRPRIAELAATARLDFPRPVAELTRGRVYTTASIQAFNRRWERRTGRPPKNA
ncbi:hypothetical protein ACQEU6_08450 [Spirillospora sp. CA-108201]